MKCQRFVFVVGLVLLFSNSAFADLGGTDQDNGNGLSERTFAAHDQYSTIDDGGGLHSSEVAHWSFRPDAPGATPAVFTVNYFIDDHGGADSLTTAMVDRINDSAGVWNASGAALSLNRVFSDAAADMHVHGASTSGCGAGALGCAESSYFTAHTPSTYGDGAAHHQMASQQVVGGVQTVTMYTRSDWYTGAAAGSIGGSEYDYMTVAIQEFGHILGLGHNSGAGAHANSASSPMNGSLGTNITRRVLQSEDLTAIQHVWGASAVPEPTSLILFGLPMAAFIGSRKRRS